MLGVIMCTPPSVTDGETGRVAQQWQPPSQCGTLLPHLGCTQHSRPVVSVRAAAAGSGRGSAAASALPATNLCSYQVGCLGRPECGPCPPPPHRAIMPTASSAHDIVVFADVSCPPDARVC